MMNTKMKKITALGLTAMILLLNIGALAAQDSVYSNTLAIEEVATLAKVVDIEENEELTGNQVCISAVSAVEGGQLPETLTVIITGSGVPEKAILNAENGYIQTVELAQNADVRNYTLIETKHYTVSQDQHHVVFTVAPQEEAVEEAAQAVEQKVSIYSSVAAGTTAYYGETVALHSALEGFEGLNYTLQWQINRGEGWQDIPNANGLVYSYELTPEDENYHYRLLVDIIDMTDITE